MAKIEIDGKEVETLQGETIIQAADRIGAYIPRFCYHHKLSIAGNCRMCLVEVEKAPKALPACATPVAEGMKVFTKTAKAMEAQKAVMEFLLINHPLDCPICDQGGQCELQDLSMGFGADTSGFIEIKRAVPNPDLGPLIATDMTRCIHCTRCVRFEEEIAGQRELGAMFRGEHMEITTYVKHTVKSELSGNAIDVCPVGALTSKPFRFKARAWELTQTGSIAPHDCLGSNINLGTLRQELLRVTPRENEAINEIWLADRDRFSYVGVHSSERVLLPMIKKNGEWQKVSWQQAFEVALESLQKVLNKSGAESFGALVSPSATCEEHYLLQAFMRGIGSNNIDHRLRQQDFSDQQAAPLMPTLGVNINDIPLQNAILLIGSNIQKDQPIAGLKVRQATLKGTKVFAVNQLDYHFNFKVAEKLIVKPKQMVVALASIAKALSILTNQDHAAKTLFADVVVSAEAKAIAEQLCAAEKATILFGLQACNHSQAGLLRQLAALIAELSGKTLGFLSEGSNAQGAWLAGCVPHRRAGGQLLIKPGLNAAEMFQQQLAAYLLLGIEPELDCADSTQALTALKQAECVIALTAFVTDRMKEYATVILPIATFGETSGTFINITGEWQSFSGVVSPQGEARPAWKVLRVLGNVFQLEGFNYVASEEVLEQLRQIAATKVFSVKKNPLATFAIGPVDDNHLQRITEVPIYSIDSLVRQSEPLQVMQQNEKLTALRVNKHTAEKLHLKAKQMVTVKQVGSLTMPVEIDERVPAGCVLIMGGIKETVPLGAAQGLVEVLG
ncbi:MAG: NADH-quinone oxidoreductase subunit G [Gammaproteobacteria bacterium RIFCSPHIGHO2_12_FULL_35_23]|nr:MAG: NADH-quinone oxidoreductase subunit G [Gammaproteobacteria bacterium RIFCSPHIGHO2_12_FULL_35_23]